MCVIMLVNDKRPSTQMVKVAWDANPDGLGIGYRERIHEGGKDSWEVCWKKGVMTVEEAQELCAETPTPYVVHFRVASVGGVKQSLTHPFLVGPEATLELEGRTRGSILFHNGHWGVWAEKAMDAALHSNNRIPVGDWSDTRAMAWMVHIYGPGFMELMTGQKGVLMTPTKTSVFIGNGWEKVEDIWCSNKLFSDRLPRQSRGVISHGGYKRPCVIGKCTNPQQSGKDICESCEKAGLGRKGSAATDSEDHTKPVVTIGVSGTNQTLPLSQLLTLKQAEEIYVNKGISKSAMKRFRKLHRQMTQGGQNKMTRAKLALQVMSSEIVKALSTGSVA